MPNERVTENLVLNKLGVNLDMPNVFAQGETNNSEIKKILRKCGGKVNEEELNFYHESNTGVGKPEFIINMRGIPNTLMIIECKKTPKKHASINLNKPKQFAVDGVLYYAKYLKEKFNVIALAVSGTKYENIKASSFEWRLGADQPVEYIRAKDVILELSNYQKLFEGKQIERKFSLDEIRALALEMHKELRMVKVAEKEKPIFIAGILIALNDPGFEQNYLRLTDFAMIMDSIIQSIKRVLKSTDIQEDKINKITGVFETLKTNTKLKSKELSENGSIISYIRKMDNCIKPMMHHAENTLDALAVFYHEFVKYSGGDGSGLGIILTPQHLTEFMCELAGVNKRSKVIDICCGSGSFLITAMTKMFKTANANEIENIRKNQLYGIDFDPELYILSIANMIIRHDGKSNIIYGDCFNQRVINKVRDKDCNVGLINPPYSQKDKVELEFLEQLLDVLTIGGKACAVVPMSCAIGTKFKEVRERLFRNHTLLAVFSMPDDIFYPTGTNVCVMLWEAHRPHSDNQKTYFGYFKEDGFVKKKKIGRVEKEPGIWDSLMKKWIKAYNDKTVDNHLSVYKHVNWNDEWLCEAYMKTDYSTLNRADFEQTIRDYYSFKVKQITTKNIDPIPMRLWKKVKIGELFEIKRGKRIVKNIDYFETQNDEFTIPVITAKATDNGVDGYYTEYNCEGNCIVSAGEANGMFTSYQESKCWVMDTARIYIPKFTHKLNKFSSLFFATILKQNMYKYSFGRKAKPNDISNIEIVLPYTKDDQLDWAYIERYIGSLPYSNKI